MALYRVYMREWTIVYSGQSTGSNGQEECERVFADKYEGRVRRDDMRVRKSASGHWVLELHRPNLQGEFTDEQAAEELRSARGDYALIVPAGSAGELDQLEYGRKMLPAAAGN
jgi:hypothetical protein